MDWLEELQLKDGQKAVLLLRYPVERANRIRFALARETQMRGAGVNANDPTFVDAVANASLWEGTKLRDYLTGDWTDDYSKADPVVWDEIQGRAFINYVNWAKDAYPGPKGSAQTGRRTRTTPEPEASGTDDES